MHTKTNEDGINGNSRSLIKICNAAIACYKLTGSLGDLDGAIKFILEMLKKEGTGDNPTSSKFNLSFLLIIHFTFFCKFLLLLISNCFLSSYLTFY